MRFEKIFVPVLLLFVIASFSGCTAPPIEPPSVPPNGTNATNATHPPANITSVCGNGMVEGAEECEKADDCIQMAGKVAKCTDCKCTYADEPGPQPPSTPECPEDKDVPWTQDCIPPLIDPIEATQRNPDGSGGWIACMPLTLAQAHQKEECKNVQTTDPACDDWEGCNAKECRTYKCIRASIPCKTHYRYYYDEASGQCKNEITQSCEDECSCPEDANAAYIQCPPANCESGCPYISAPEPGGGSTVVIGGTMGTG